MADIIAGAIAIRTNVAAESVALLGAVMFAVCYRAYRSALYAAIATRNATEKIIRTLHRSGAHLINVFH